MKPEAVVKAIWDRWERDLKDWDLEGCLANTQAYQLAVEAVANL